MEPYKSLSGKKAGVSAYEIGENYITVQFGGKSIKYLEASNNKTVIDHMKSLAVSSKGLTSYILKNSKTLKSVILVEQLS